MPPLPQSSLRTVLQKSFPLPALFAGYLTGLLCAVLMTLTVTQPNELLLRPSDRWTAFADCVSAELPFWIAATLIGFSRLPHTASLPIGFRSFLFGYASLQVYLFAENQTGYFFFVLGSALTLLPLSCVTKLAKMQSAHSGRLTGSDQLRYLFRCLYYWGLTLIILFIRSSMGALLR